MGKPPRKPKLKVKKKTLTSLDDKALKGVVGGLPEEDVDSIDSCRGTCGNSNKFACQTQHNRRALRFGQL